MSRWIAFGDIHGMYDKLINLYNSLDITDDDTLIFLGDYIDRGPDSKEVLDFLIDLEYKRGNNIFLYGNHEDMMLYDKRLWLYNGGYGTLKSLNGHKASMYIAPKYLDFIKNSTKVFHETDNFVFVHAGINPYTKDWRDDKNEMLWIRETFFKNGICPTDKTIIFGHTPFKEVFKRGNKIGIDTGACFPLLGKLTCAILPCGDLTTVKDIRFKSA